MIIKRTSHSAVLIIILIIACCITACNPNKNLTSTTTSGIKHSEANVFYNKYYENTLKYNTLSMKYKGRFDDGDKKLSFSGSIKIKKDSAIWVNVLAMGFEVARIVFTVDSVKLLNRFNSLYYAGKYNYVEQKANIPLNYNILQSVLTNVAQPLNKQKNMTFPDDYIFTADSSFAVLQSHTDEDVMAAIKPGSNLLKPFFEKLLFNANLKGNLQKQEVKDYASLRFAVINYAGFEEFENTVFPMEINLNTSKNNHKIDIDLKYSKVDINNQLTFPFSIPDNYKKIN